MKPRRHLLLAIAAVFVAGTPVGTAIGDCCIQASMIPKASSCHEMASMRDQDASMSMGPSVSVADEATSNCRMDHVGVRPASTRDGAATVVVSQVADAVPVREPVRPILQPSGADPPPQSASLPLWLSEQILLL